MGQVAATEQMQLWHTVDIAAYQGMFVCLGDLTGEQAFAVDLCVDAREELVLYQPYNGRAILIFTQEDSNGRKKAYVHERDAYNIRSYV